MKNLTLCLLTLANVALADEHPLIERKHNGTLVQVVYNDIEQKRFAMLDTQSQLDTITTTNGMSTNGMTSNGTTTTGGLAVTTHTAADELQVRRFFLNPMVGLQLATLGASLWRNADGTVDGRALASGVAAAPMYGVGLGWRLGFFNVGLKYQGSVFNAVDLPRLTLNKVYGEFGFNSRQGRMLINGYLNYGWSSAASPTELYNGMGGKVGIGLDFLVTRFFSVGPAIEFDVDAYSMPSQWVVAYGGTGALRVGFHL